MKPKWLLALVPALAVILTWSCVQLSDPVRGPEIMFDSTATRTPYFTPTTTNTPANTPTTQCASFSFDYESAPPGNFDHVYIVGVPSYPQLTPDPHTGTYSWFYDAFAEEVAAIYGYEFPEIVRPNVNDDTASYDVSIAIKVLETPGPIGSPHIWKLTNLAGNIYPPYLAWNALGADAWKLAGGNGTAGKQCVWVLPDTLNDGAWHTIRLKADVQPYNYIGTPEPYETPALVEIDGTPQAIPTCVGTPAPWHVGALSNAGEGTPVPTQFAYYLDTGTDYSASSNPHEQHLVDDLDASICAVVPTPTVLPFQIYSGDPGDCEYPSPAATPMGLTWTETDTQDYHGPSAEFFACVTGDGEWVEFNFGGEARSNGATWSSTFETWGAGTATPFPVTPAPVATYTGGLGEYCGADYEGSFTTFMLPGKYKLGFTGGTNNCSFCSAYCDTSWITFEYNGAVQTVTPTPTPTATATPTAEPGALPGTGNFWFTEVQTQQGSTCRDWNLRGGCNDGDTFVEAFARQPLALDDYALQIGDCLYTFPAGSNIAGPFVAFNDEFATASDSAVPCGQFALAGDLALLDPDAATVVTGSYVTVTAGYSYAAVDCTYSGSPWSEAEPSPGYCP